MSEAIAALSDAMRNDAETLRVIGQNVANMETTAYRREIAVLRPFDQVADDARVAVERPLAMETVVDQRPYCWRCRRWPPRAPPIIPTSRSRSS